MTIPHLAFVGFSGSGKTTLASQVVTQLKRKGYRIGVLKHDAHDFEMDVEGKDTHRYGAAGADLVAISSSTKLNILEQYPSPLPLQAILRRMTGVDLIIIEGYKQENVPKILVARTLEQLALNTKVSELLAIASSLDEDDSEIKSLLKSSDKLPFLDINDITIITQFIEKWLMAQQSLNT
jgi:molybdopterin-guanine dinucleotide biosynthesis protein B